MNARELQEFIQHGPPGGNEMAVIKIQVSMWLLFKVANEGIVAEAYSSFSDYVQGLIRDDRLRREQSGTDFAKPPTNTHLGGVTMPTARAAEQPPAADSPRKLGFKRDGGSIVALWLAAAATSILYFPVGAAFGLIHSFGGVA